MPVLQRLDVLSVGRLKTERVPFGDDVVIVSELGASDSYTLFTDPQYQVDGSLDMAKFAPALLARAIVNEDGSRMFTDDDATELARLNRDTFSALSEVAMRLSGLSGAAHEGEIKN